MATNRDLLKEAIADAKSVRETALANAKAALEESFTPQLKSMLSAKLNEIEEEDQNLEEDLFEVEDGEGIDEDLDLNEFLSELNEAEEEEESEETEETESEEEGEPLDLEDMTDEDLKKMIEDVIADMIAAGELEAGEGAEGEEVEDMEGEEVEDEEEVDLEELLAEIESLDEEDDDMMYKEEELEEGFMDKIVRAVNRFGSSGAVEDLIKIELPKVVDAATTTGKLPKDFKPSQEMIDSLTLKAKEDGGTGTIIFKDGKIQYRPGLETPASPSLSTHESLQTELEEAYATIKTLRSDLNEVNLLNAKLLYTNKIFKAKNLTENQKLKVLGMFDKATSVKETKLVYETLSEGLKDTRKPIKESLGSASKTMSTPTKKQPILESNDMVARFQKLAGIIKD